VIARRLSEIARAIGGSLRGEDPVASTVATDSQQVGAGSLFVALRGERSDGHAFVGDAFERGAAGALVRAGAEVEALGSLIEVDDTGRALLRLAADERDRRPDVVVVGITGANGKASTKDLAAAVISTHFRTHASPASFNNEIGVPVTMLGAPPETEVLVAELGARREGDVRDLCAIVRPQIAVVTNVGVAHLGIFGSWEAIVAAGAEPVEALDADDVAILNADDPVAAGYRGRASSRVRTFGLAPSADVRADHVELDLEGRASFDLMADGERERVELAVPGAHMVPNALAAAACGLELGISAAESAAALKGARVSRWRMEIETTERGVRILNDAYNANPESMAAGLRTARWIARGARLVAVLGHMAELGEIERREHERLGQLVVRLGVDRLVTVGDRAAAIADAAVREGQRPDDVASYDDPLEAAADVRAWARPGDLVFLKGSRVARLELAAEALR
jgi:UDP-N-acetylmuramoyl-tripeptide--D-alanyl-D-alanine ligase